MKELSLILVLFISLISACGDSNKAPEGLIPPKKMSLIIKDMTLLEATYNTKLIRVKNKSELMKKFGSEILNEHSVTIEEFDLSYEYYVKNSEIMEEILELVFEELNKMETESSKFNEGEITPDSTITIDLPEDN